MEDLERVTSVQIKKKTTGNNQRQKRRKKHILAGPNRLAVAATRRVALPAVVSR